MWVKLEGGVKDADDITDALKEELVAVVPGLSRFPVLDDLLSLLYNRLFSYYAFTGTVW